MPNNVETLQAGYEAFGKGDIATATQSWTDDFRWEGSNDSLPGGGVSEGKEAATQTLTQAVAAWDSFSLEVDEMIGEGDTITVLANQSIEKDGRSAKVPVVHIWRFEGGQITRMQIAIDTLELSRVLHGA